MLDIGTTPRGTRNFRLLVAGRTISVLGDRALIVALAFAVLELGGGPAQVGLVLAAANVPLIFSTLIGGVLADRLPRRSVMLAADLLRTATQASMAILLLAGAAEVWMLAALAAVTGLGTGFFQPASTGLLPQFVASDDLQRANATLATTTAAGEIAGPVVGGLLVAAAGAGAAIAVDAATFALSALCLAAMRFEHRPVARSASFVRDLKDGWLEFSGRRWIWGTIAYFSVANVMWAAWAALGPIVADRSLGGAGAWGLVLGASGAGMVAGGLAAVRIDPHRPLLVLALSEGVFALPLAFLASGAPAPFLALGSFVSGAAMMVGMSVWETTLQRHIPPESISRVASYDWFGSYLFTPIGLALWGPVAALIGLHEAVWFAFGLMLVMVAAMLALPDTRSLPRLPENDDGRVGSGSHAAAPGPTAR